MPHNGGRANINIWTPRPYIDCVFINACKQMRGVWTAVNATEETRVLLDSRGYPTRMPTGSGAKWETAQLWIDRPLPGDVYVLDWPGTATLALSAYNGTATLTLSSSNRKEYTFLSGIDPIELESGYNNPAAAVLITISAMDENAFAGGSIRLFNKANESLLNAGEIFDPRFKARVSPFGWIRFLDYMLSDGQDNNAAWWEHRSEEDDFTYTSAKIHPPAWCGVSTGTNAQVVPQPPSPISSWTNGQLIQWEVTSVPVYGAITAVTNANPGVFTWAGHPLEDGDLVEFQPRSYGESNWRALTQQSPTTGDVLAFPVTKLSADTFSIGVNTTSYGVYSESGYLIAYKQVTLKVGTLDPVPCARLQRATSFYMAADFAAGRKITGVWDATLQKLMLGGDAGVMLGLHAGFPVSVLMSLAVTSGAHPWFTIPVLAVDDYVTQYATAVRDSQPDWMVPIYEYANEIWNYWGTGNITAWALKDPAIASADLDSKYSKRCGEMADLIAAVYEGSGKRFKFSIGVRASGASGTTSVNRRLKCPPVSGYVDAGNPGNVALYPASKCHAIHCNPYYRPAFFNRNDAASYDGGALVDAIYNYLQGGALRESAFDWLRDEFQYASNDVLFSNVFYLDNFNDVYMPEWKAIADVHIGRDGTPLELNHYEGGPEFSANSFDGGFPTTHTGSGTTITVANVREFVTAFGESRQFGHLLRKQCEAAVAAGVTIPAQYVIAGPEIGSQTFGLWRLNDFNQPANPAYLELLDWNNRKRRLRLVGS